MNEKLRTVLLVLVLVAIIAYLVWSDQQSATSLGV